MRSDHIFLGMIGTLVGASFSMWPARPLRPDLRQESTVPQAQQSSQQQDRASDRTEPRPSAPTKDQKTPSLPEEKTSITHHVARVGGQQINYTATAATYIIKTDDGTPKASMFYVAYTKESPGEIYRRPISFVYNGGPGSASFFTHMGMGPKRVALTSDGHGTPAPYTVVDNDDSFLDATDLVFIDAISTGYSRPMPDEKPSQFYGIIPDANWFADFIYQYITRNERWSSPKYLIGESYGTTRSAELAGVIQQRHQIYLNGIVLLSSVPFSDWGADNLLIMFVPTYATTAWYHHLLSPALQALSIEDIAQQAREFAHGEYARALEKGDDLSAAERDKVVQDLARFTALSPKYIEQTNLRISAMRWFKELQRDKRRTIGQLDTRFEGIDADAAGERPEYDPSEVSYEGAFVATFQDYVRRELNWQSDMYYTVSANLHPWDETGGTKVAEVLRAAMTQQSTLKVLVLSGYYDANTPFNGIEHTFTHMNLEPPIAKNVSFAYYEAGHMMYIDEKEHHKLHKDVVAFINSAYTQQVPVPKRRQGP
jgi:carboxypeptidase C (cathepsin A)